MCITTEWGQPVQEEKGKGTICITSPMTVSVNPFSGRWWWKSAPTSCISCSKVFAVAPLLPWGFLVHSFKSSTSFTSRTTAAESV